MSKPASKHGRALNVNAELLAGVREVEARRGTGPGSPGSILGDPADRKRDSDLPAGPTRPGGE